MNRWLSPPLAGWLLLGLRLLAGIVFIYASLDKIVHPDQFARVIYNYKILPGELINLLAIWLPWLELFAGGFLILGLWLRASALLILLMLVIFMVAIGINVIRGVNLVCGCFTTSPTAKAQGAELLLRDLGLFIAVLVVFLWSGTRFFRRSSGATRETVSVSPSPKLGNRN